MESKFLPLSNYSKLKNKLKPFLSVGKGLQLGYCSMYCFATASAS